MIRKLIFLILIGISFFACKDDDEISFDVPVEFQTISFKPVPGGAVMHYKLPDNLEIFGVRARYTNAYGEELIKDGTYLVDTILLSGFTEAQTTVPVKLSFFNSEFAESEPIELTFDTEAAATVAVFDNLTVNPFWGGFNVTYKSPQTVEGTIHVFYIGTNPTTQQLDSILMGSYPIVEGGDTLNFEIAQDLDQLDVVVRTDDYEGHRVKMEIYRDVPALIMDKLASEDFDFQFMGNIQEKEEYGLGTKYLFDGKKKGDGYRSHYMVGENRIFDTFVAGPEAFGKRFIFDLGSPKVPAALYGYAYLNFDMDFPDIPSYIFPGEEVDLYIGGVWRGTYHSRLPCKLKVYGTNENPETVDLASCALLYTLNDEPDYTVWLKSWCKNTNWANGGPGQDFSHVTDEAFNEADPIVLRMVCNYTGETFRYLILVVEDTYYSNRWSGDYPSGYEENADEYITFDEIEVFVKAE